MKTRKSELLEIASVKIAPRTNRPHGRSGVCLALVLEVSFKGKPKGNKFVTVVRKNSNDELVELDQLLTYPSMGGFFGQWCVDTDGEPEQGSTPNTLSEEEKEGLETLILFWTVVLDRAYANELCAHVGRELRVPSLHDVLNS